VIELGKCVHCTLAIRYILKNTINIQNTRVAMMLLTYATFNNCKPLELRGAWSPLVCHLCDALERCSLPTVLIRIAQKKHAYIQLRTRLNNAPTGTYARTMARRPVLIRMHILALIHVPVHVRVCVCVRMCVCVCVCACVSASVHYMCIQYVC
jgi:hypothetical protein